MNQLARNNYYHLIFDNEDITQRTGFYLLTMERDTEFNVGVNRNIKTTEGTFGRKIFLGVQDDTFDFDITLVKAKEINNTLITEEIHDEDIEELLRYVIKKEPKAIEKNDRLYYGNFTTANGWYDSANQGYVNFKFIMSEPYLYSKTVEREFDTSIENEIELKNYTDLIDEKTSIDVEFSYPYLNILDTSVNEVGVLNDGGDVITSKVEDDGTTTSYENMRTSDFIDTYERNNLYSNVSIWCWYDRNKKFISQFAKGNYEMALLEKPENARYLRVSFYNYRLENFHMIINGGIPTSYIGYIGTNIPVKFTNITNNSYIELNSLKGNNYEVYGEEKQIINTDDYREIVYSSNFINLDYKLNTIKIDCDLKITGKIKYQIKYGIK